MPGKRILVEQGTNQGGYVSECGYERTLKIEREMTIVRSFYLIIFGPLGQKNYVRASLVERFVLFSLLVAERRADIVIRPVKDTH